MAAEQMRKALLIAYHYPPIQVSSGVQRTLAISKYLRDHQWQSVVLTAHPRAYELTSTDQLQDVPEGVEVCRAFALDTARHLSFRGRYLQWMALPDRWVSWVLGGFVSGLKLIRKHRPEVIWATYPIGTAFLLAVVLSKVTGIPWVADFRDSMLDDSYPRDKWQRKAHRLIERWVINSCQSAIFTTPSTLKMYKARYPHIPDSRWKVVPNGYNEEIFSDVERKRVNSTSAVKGSAPLVLLHSGVVYASERNPSHLFQALSELKSEGAINADRLQVVFRASAHEDLYQPEVEALGISDLVIFKPAIGYRDALEEMLSVDALLVLQGASCNHQVPAKIYEYFRAGKPLLSLTDKRGDTAATLESVGQSSIARLDCPIEIKLTLLEFLQGLEAHTLRGADALKTAQYSRQEGAAVVATVFEKICG